MPVRARRPFVAVHPTAHSLACLRIGVFVTADAVRLATGVGGSPFTGRVSHPLDGEQSFMTSPHRHSPLTSLAWSHRAPTPPMDDPHPVHPGAGAGQVEGLGSHLYFRLEFFQESLQGILTFAGQSFPVGPERFHNRAQFVQI